MIPQWKLKIIQLYETSLVRHGIMVVGSAGCGKSTIFKQMRIIYGNPRDDENLRMFGVVIRSNCITVTRKLCQVIRMLELEDDLEEEPAGEDGMTPFVAFELLVYFCLSKLNMAVKERKKSLN